MHAPKIKRKKEKRRCKEMRFGTKFKRQEEKKKDGKKRQRKRKRRVKEEK